MRIEECKKRRKLREQNKQNFKEGGTKRVGFIISVGGGQGKDIV